VVVEKEEEGEEKVVSVIRDGSKKKNSKEKKRERKKRNRNRRKKLQLQHTHRNRPCTVANVSFRTASSPSFVPTAISLCFGRGTADHTQPL